MNEGKKFEQDFIRSLPEGSFHLRLKDGGGWSNADNTRFTSSNICDSVVYYQGKMILVELKSHKGKSVPFSCLKQHEDLSRKTHDVEGVCGVFVINFRDMNETYMIWSQLVTDFIELYERKSLPIAYVKEYGYLIPQKLKRTRYRYDPGQALLSV